MKIYNYSSTTFEFLNESDAYLNPVATKREHKEVYMLPAYATFDEPPQTSEHQIQVWLTDKWVIKDDYRGMYKVNETMNPELITSIGSLDEGYAAITPEQAETILSDPLYYIYDNGEVIKNPNYEEDKFTQAKAEKYAENDTKASQSRYSKEFTITIQEQECVFDTKATTQADLLTAFAVCSTGATYDGWVTNNGVELDLTLEDVALISQTFKVESNVYGKWNEYKQAIDNAETIEDIERIEIDYD